MKTPRLAAPRAGRGLCGQGGLAVWFAAGFGIALSVSATGQTTQPTGTDMKQHARATDVAPGQPQRGVAPIERQPIARSSQPQSGGTGSPTSAVPAATFDLQRVLLALLAVVGLIFLMRFVARRLFAGVAVGRSSSSIRVLSRSVLSPKQQVMLLQVGRRVIVVGDSGTHMSALTEITDADEIAALIGQLEAEKRPITSAFGGIFGKAQSQFEQIDAKSRQHPGDVAGHEPDDEPQHEASQRQLAAAQGEIEGLMQRVRGLSQQFRKS